MNICLSCGGDSDQDICRYCAMWGVTVPDVLPTREQLLAEQFHRIGKEGRKYWGKAGAGILFTDGNSILLLKRKEPSDHAGTWGIPGGRAKEKESPIDTALRETEEECGVGARGKQIARFHEKDGHHNFHVFVYKVATPFDCKVSNEHSESKWVALAELKNYELHPRLRESLPHYLRAVNTTKRPFSEWLAARKTLDSTSDNE